METFFLQTPGPTGQLIHFTQSLGALESILQHGFLYVHNETETHRHLLDSLGVSYPDVERGMVSFTVVEWDKSEEIRRVFGAFGIAVDFNWALDQGARQVAYIPSSGPLFEALRTLVREGLPTQNHWDSFLGSEGEGPPGLKLKEGILSDPGLHGAFTTPLHSLILELLHWVQTDEHSFEQEYRIRSSHTFGGISAYRPADQVELLKVMTTKLGLDYSLSLPIDAVLYFCCPASFESEVSQILARSRFAGKPIRLYPSHQ